MVLLTREDVLDIIHGSAVLGSGGGGHLSEALYYAEKAFATSEPLHLRSISETPAEMLTCTPTLMGVVEDPIVANDDKPPAIMRALQMASRATQGSISAIVPSEAGAANVALAFYVAAMMKGFVVDGDHVGRAVPEVGHSKVSMVGLSPGLTGVANELGESFLMEGVKDGNRLETLLRPICGASDNDISVTSFIMEMGVLKKGLCEGSMSRALAIGRGMRGGGDVGKGVAEGGGGKVLFTGRVVGGESKKEGGFTRGVYRIDGEGGRFEVEFKNENMVGRLNGEVVVTIPEIICVIGKGGVVVNPTKWEEVGEVAVVVLPAPEHYLGEGLEVFGPKYVGLDKFESALG